MWRPLDLAIMKLASWVSSSVNARDEMANRFPNLAVVLPVYHLLDSDRPTTLCEDGNLRHLVNIPMSLSRMQDAPPPPQFEYIGQIQAARIMTWSCRGISLVLDHSTGNYFIREF